MSPISKAAIRKWSIVITSLGSLVVVAAILISKLDDSLIIQSDGSGMERLARHFDNQYIESVNFYNAPSVMIENGAVSIDTSNHPSGVSISLSGATPYRVTVGGTSVSGRTTLRIRKGEAAPAYVAAPSGTRAYTIDTTQSEFLFYSDESSRYRLLNVAIEECPECKTDEDLRQLLMNELPGLGAALENDRMEAAKLLLDWAAKNSNYALSGEVEAKTTSIFSEMTAAEIYFDVFLSDTGGVFCGGFSVFLDKLLKLFEFNSITVNFGDLADDLTHVTVFVPFNEQGDLRWYMLDPTFNLTLEDDGEILSLMDLVRYLREERVEEIDVNEKPAPGRDYIALKSDERLCNEVKKDTGDLLVCDTLDMGIEQYFENWSGLMEKNGYAEGLEGFLQLMTNRVFHVGASIDRSYSELFVARLEELGIPTAN